MKRAILFATVCLLVAIICVIILHPDAAPSKSLIISVTPDRSAPSDSLRYDVCISNRSPFTILYPISGTVPMFTQYLNTNGAWGEHQLGGPGRGNTVLLPGHVAASKVSMPEGISKFRLELSFTSLTWRGRLALKVATSRYQSNLGWLTAFLMRPDLASRSAKEISEDYVIIASLPVNP